QARRPETIGFHLLIGQSSPITILVAKIRPDFVAKMARRQPRRPAAALGATLRRGDRHHPLQEDQLDPEQSTSATIVHHPRRSTSQCEGRRGSTAGNPAIPIVVYRDRYAVIRH